MTGTGAMSVVGVNIGRYFYKGQNDDGVHIFHTEDFGTVVTLDPDEVTDVEQTRRDLEELEILRRENKRELLKVEETIVDGTLEMRVHVYKYTLSDGRTMDMREGAAGAYALGNARMEEYFRIRKAGSGENLGTYEETVEGGVFFFKRHRYYLSDGTEVLFAVGFPKDDQ